MRCKNRFIGGAGGEYESHRDKGAEPQRASSRPSSGTQLRIRRAAQLLTPIVGKSAAGSRLRIDPPPRARRLEVNCGSTRLLTPIVEKSAAEPRRASSRRTSRRCRTSTCVSALQEQIRRCACWRVQEPRPQRRRASARLLTPFAENPAADRTRGAAPHAHPWESAAGSRLRIDPPPRARRLEINSGSMRLPTAIENVSRRSLFCSRIASRRVLVAAHRGQRDEQAHNQGDMAKTVHHRFLERRHPTNNVPAMPIRFFPPGRWFSGSPRPRCRVCTDTSSLAGPYTSVLDPQATNRSFVQPSLPMAFPSVMPRRCTLVSQPLPARSSSPARRPPSRSRRRPCPTPPRRSDCASGSASCWPNRR